MKQIRSYIITALSSPTEETFPTFKESIFNLCKDKGIELKALKVYSGEVCCNIFIQLEGDYINSDIRGINLIASVLAYNLKTNWSFTDEPFESGYTEKP